MLRPICPYVYGVQSLEHFGERLLLFLQVYAFQLLRSVKFFLEISVCWLDLAEMRQCCDSCVEFINCDLRFAAEEECLGMVGRHLDDLICNRNHRLVLFHLEFAHHQIGEACQFERLEICCCLLELVGLFVFLQVIVPCVSKVEVAIDLLVYLRRFLVVRHLEELTGSDLQSRDISELVDDAQLVEVRGVLDAEEGDGELDCVSLFEGCVLVEELRLEVGVEFVFDTCCCHRSDSVLLQGFDELLEETWEHVVVEPELEE